MDCQLLNAGLHFLSKLDTHIDTIRFLKLINFYEILFFSMRNPGRNRETLS